MNLPGSSLERDDPAESSLGRGGLVGTGLPGVGSLTGAWMAYSPCDTECLPGADDVPRASPLLRLARYAGLLGLLLAGLAMVPVMPLAGRAGRALATRLWCRALLATLGVRLSVTDAGVWGGGGMVVANHVSWLDVPALAAIAPYRILAKRDIASWPVIGTLATIAGTLYIDRERLRTLPRTVAELRDVLHGGRSVLVFPSGTTFCGRKPERFRPATFQAAIDAEAPVRPVAIRYRLADGRTST
ncbi:MAG: lysophospholipid acyltransferase family protein, partial [Micromonosporaceae bacterium]